MDDDEHHPRRPEAPEHPKRNGDHDHCAAKRGGSQSIVYSVQDEDRQDEPGMRRGCPADAGAMTGALHGRYFPTVRNVEPTSRYAVPYGA
jgi:hypothetical protein